jgi:hypothetical protein
MSLRFRRSVSVAGVRLNVGKRGITSISTGVRGFRVTTGKNGTRVTAGIPGTGLSYTQRIGQPTPRHVPVPEPLPSADVQVIQTADVSELAELSSQALLDRINKRAGQFPLFVLPAVAFLLALYPAYIIWNVLIAPVLVIGIIATWWVHRIDIEGRTTRLHYELDEQAHDHHDTVIRSLEHLAQSEMVWQVTSKQGAEWKHHGGASTLIDRHRAIISKASPPFISTNVAISSIGVNATKLFFLPDQVLVWQQGKYGAVSYESLSINANSTRFVETSSVPRDATVVGTTWLHPNKNGSPDRRFANNRQLSIAHYGVLELSSPTGLNIHLQVSSYDLAGRFVGCIQKTQCRTNSSIRP